MHNGFLGRLKGTFPNLENVEVKLCVLPRLNTNQEESASILGISLDSVKEASHRLRKKLGLVDFGIRFEQEKLVMN